MIGERLAVQAARLAGREFLWSPSRTISYESFRSEVERCADSLHAVRGMRVGLSGTSTAWLVRHLFALDTVEASTCLVAPGMALADADHHIRLGLQAWVSEAEGIRLFAAPREPHVRGQLILHTSGTLGRSRAALHTWESLAARVRLHPKLDGSTWLLTYDLTTFAGLQVLLHVLFNGGTLIMGEGAPAALARQAAKARATHISGTPSFFRLLLSSSASEDLDGLHPRQITLGGEATDNRLLKALAQRFPSARISQIYASTEAGACFSVEDGQEGFPASYLSETTLGVELRIVDDELWVRSSRGMQGYLGELDPGDAEGFLPTGDVVEVRGDRVFFRGRTGERINVGGRKAYPGEIEAAVLEVAGVQAVRVQAASSPLLGQIVTAAVVWGGGDDLEDARARIVRHCGGRLRAYMVPRVIEFVPTLDLTSNGKVRRV